MMNIYGVESADAHQPLITLVDNPKLTISALVEMYRHNCQYYICYSIKVEVNNNKVKVSYYYYYYY
jgi:hypothetical protein